MNKKEFIKIIRETVTAEIKRSLKTELKNILSPPDNNANTFNEDIQRSAQLQHISEQTPDSQEKYSSNEMLNGILNETADSMKSYPTAGRSLSSQDALGGRSSLAAAMGMESMHSSGQPSLQEMIPPDRRGAQIPEAVSNALTKDYSQLMKTINKKKNNK
jgi:hypothetical protein